MDLSVKMDIESTQETAQTSRDEQEIANFSAQADSWWDPTGPFAPLHQLNPARLRILFDMMARHFERSIEGQEPFRGLSLADMGCGGGLVTEPCARLGFEVLGLDASAENISTARSHADEGGLDITYQVGAPEQLKAGAIKYDVVLALEVIEHVADVDVFIEGLSRHLSPGGLLVMSTINRTVKSMLLAKAAAEYVLRWVPRGTHQWKKFVRPSELTNALRSCGFRVVDIQGMTFSLATGEWSASRDVDVNYMLAATPASR